MQQRHIKRALVLTLALASTAALAFPAAAAEPTKQRFYIFDGTAFDVNARGPALDQFRSEKRPEFGRLLSLKKSLVPGIYQARHSRVFK